MSIVCYDSENRILKTFYQWDINQTMVVRGASASPLPVFHFCNRSSDKALVVTPTIVNGDIVVGVPNVLLQQADPIISYLYEETGNEGFRTVHVIHIPVVPRPRPSDYEYIENISYPSYESLSARIDALENSSGSTEPDGHRVDGLYYNNNMLYLTCQGEIVSAPVEIISGGSGVMVSQNSSTGELTIS